MSPDLVQSASTASILLAFAALELLRGRFFPPEAVKEDNRLDIAVTLGFPFISLGVLGTSIALSHLAIPDWQGALSHWPWWGMILTLLLADDLTQYWWHRLSHTSRFWPLHRAHHSAGYMSVRVVYRNNAFYYAMMPGLWLSGLLVFLGFGWVYVGYVIVKVGVIIGAHSSVRWDEKLYQTRWTRPLMWVIERTISTPATHYAHHALSQDDGIGPYSGNFGNLLFLWDIIFGTAHITRRYPPAFGLADDRQYGHEPWYTQMFFPVLQSTRKNSALRWPPGRPPE
jgi:sterol desaturase/sphingolipid hydroxylase (fatty acid hydroxylase superfamily)